MKNQNNYFAEMLSTRNASNENEKMQIKVYNACLFGVRQQLAKSDPGNVSTKDIYDATTEAFIKAMEKVTLGEGSQSYGGCCGRTAVFDMIDDRALSAGREKPSNVIRRKTFGEECGSAINPYAKQRGNGFFNYEEPEDWYSEAFLSTDVDADTDWSLEEDPFHGADWDERDEAQEGNPDELEAEPSVESPFGAMPFWEDELKARQAARENRSRIVRESYAMLSDRDKAICNAIQEGKSSEEMAEQFGCSTGTLYKSTHDFRARFEKNLRKNGYFSQAV